MRTPYSQPIEIPQLLEKLLLFIELCQCLYADGIKKLVVSIDYEEAYKGFRSKKVRDFKFDWPHQTLNCSWDSYFEQLKNLVDRDFLEYLKESLSRRKC